MRQRAFPARASIGAPGAARHFNPNLAMGAALLFIAAALCPFLVSEFKVGLIGLGLTYGLFAIGLDLAWGRTKHRVDRPNGFFGLGVYSIGDRAYPSLFGAARRLDQNSARYCSRCCYRRSRPAPHHQSPPP
ncbi:MAG: hypothetical protein R3D52_03395 [Xanthobacteraceae bacterium]